MANEKKLVSAAEADKISRNVLIWLNDFDELPVDIIRFEYLTADSECMALSTIQSAYITANYILGGHRAEYQFKVIYRLKPGSSNDKRLKADELLNRLGAWASENAPDLGDGIRVVKVEMTAQSSLFAMYENGDEDHQILMKLTYEVI